MIASPAYAGRADFYGSDGSYQGTMHSAGPNNNFIYGRDGSYAVSTAKAGNSIYFYGRNGSYVGSSKSIGNIRAE